MDNIQSKYEELLRKFDDLLLDYFDSRSLLYLAAGIFLWEKVGTHIAIVFSIMFMFCSFLLLPAQLFSVCRVWAQHIDRMFRTGETIITLGMLFVGSMVPSTKPDIILPMLLVVLCWSILWVVVKSKFIANAIGVFRFIVLFITAYSVLVLCVGTVYIWLYRFAIIAAIIGLALMPSILSSWLFPKDR